MSFWGELKRRNVYKVGVAYAIVAWLLIQATAIVSPALQLPKWTLPLIIILLSIGFLITLFLAWAYEVTPEGIKRTKEVPLAESITHLTGQKLNYIVTGLLVVAVAFIIIDNYLTERHAVEQELVSTETEQAPVVSDVQEAPKTIAVLPFVNRSSEKDQEYFVDGLSDEIITMLSQISDLQVTSSTSSFAFKNTDKTLHEVANVLGVDHILEGSVRKAGNDLRITAQLIRVEDDYHLWSETYNRELKDIFAVQEDIATAVANELKVTLGIGESLKQLGGTDNVEAYELYLVAQGVGNYLTDSAEGLALKSLDEAIALDPKFALAWASKSIIHTFLVISGPASRIAIEQEMGLHAAKKSVELEPNQAAGYYALGYARSIKGELIEAELAYQKALKLTTDPLSFSQPVIAIHYHVVGYFKRANELLEEMIRNDPLNIHTRRFYIESYVLLGDKKRADEEISRAKAFIFGDQLEFITSGYYLASGDVLTSDSIMLSNQIWDEVKEHLGSPKEALAKLHQLYSDNNLSVLELCNISLLAAYFDDPDLAIDAIEKTISIESSSLFNIWFPVMRDVRQTPRFKKFVQEIGLVDYWNEFGWPDICRPLDNGDFECD